MSKTRHRSDEKLAESAVGQLWLRALLALAHTYGFRKAELLGMRCVQVDLLNDTISLYSGETKNGEGRFVALTRECRELVTELRKGKQAEDFLFTRDSGDPVRDLRGTWEALVKAAGLPGLLLHDFRRSAGRNMIRRGYRRRRRAKFPATRQMQCSTDTTLSLRRIFRTRHARWKQERSP